MGLGGVGGGQGRGSELVFPGDSGGTFHRGEREAGVGATGHARGCGRRHMPALTHHAQKAYVTTPSRVEVLGGGENGAVISMDGGVNHSAAVTEDGRVWTWGSASNHVLGHGDDLDKKRTVPAVVGGDLAFEKCKKVVCGDTFTVALTEDGRLYSWGMGGTWLSAGALGHGNSTDQPFPKMIESLHGAGVNVVDVDCGLAHCLALDDAGFVWWVGAVL